MKVLWFSNCILSDVVNKGSGSWLSAMKNIMSGYVNIVNITDSNVDHIIYKTSDKFEEYILPNFKLTDGLPSENNIKKILKIIETVSPDIIHIWGLERYWGRLYSRGYLKGKVLIEIQGVLSACANASYAGLNEDEIRICYGLKEILRPSLSIKNQYKSFLERAVYENEVLSKSMLVSTQSNWTRAQLSFIIPSTAKVFSTEIPIRSEFVNSTKWNKNVNKDNIVIYTSISYNRPFKGLHMLLKALELLNRKYPEIKLNISGDKIDTNSRLRRSGYEKFLLKLIHDKNLENCVNFVGRLNAQQVTDYLLDADVFVNPSFVESYSVVAAEALYLGVPSVLAFAGAMPDFSEQDTTALYYSPMDFVACAAQIDKLINDNSLQNKLNKNAISFMENKCNNESVRNIQMKIYNEIYNK